MKNTTRTGSPARPHKQPRLRKAALKRQAILDAALAEFAGKGFAGARMEDVARRAGVGKGTLYLYFNDKEALFEGLILDFAVTPLAALSAPQLPAGGSVGALLKAAMPSLAQATANSRRGDIVRLLVGDGVRFPGLADSYRKNLVEPMLERLDGLLNRAARNGELANQALLEFPQLVVGPIIVGIVWTGLFGRAIPLDVEKMMRVHLDILFPGRRDLSSLGDARRGIRSRARQG